RAVRAEEGEDLSPSHLEIDARNRLVAAIALNQTAHADDRLGLGRADGWLIYAVFFADAVHLAPWAAGLRLRVLVGLTWRCGYSRWLGAQASRGGTRRRRASAASFSHLPGPATHHG